MEVQERGATGRLRVAVGHRDSRRLLQREDVVEALACRPGQRIDQGELGAAGVAEEMPNALGAEHLEQHFASVSC